VSNISAGVHCFLGTMHYRVMEFLPSVLLLFLKMVTVFFYISGMKFYIFFSKIYKKWFVGKNILEIPSQIDHCKNKKALKYTGPSNTCVPIFAISIIVFAKLCI
jgi:hypothetical protein